MSSQPGNTTGRRVRRAFAGGVLLLLVSAGGWVFVQAHSPTIGNALTSEWVLKPRVYDLLRFGCAAVAILGLASLLQAVLIALQSPGRSVAVATERPARSEGEAVLTQASASPPNRGDQAPLRGAAFFGMGVAIAVLGMGAVLLSRDPATQSNVPAATAKGLADALAEAEDDSFSAADAKGTVRGTLSSMEACYTETSDYAECDAPSELTNLPSNFAIADEPLAGETSLYGRGDELSITSADSDGRMWSIAKRADGTITRKCVFAGDFTPCEPPTW